jgi:hypothetical protein
MSCHPRQPGSHSTITSRAWWRGFRGAVLWIVMVAVVNAATGLRPVQASDADAVAAGMREFLARHCTD